MESISYKELEKWILRNKKTVHFYNSHTEVAKLGLVIRPKYNFRLFKGLVTTDCVIKGRDGVDISSHFSKKERMGLYDLLVMVEEVNKLDKEKKAVKDIKKLMKE